MVGLNTTFSDRAHQMAAALFTRPDPLRCKPTAAEAAATGGFCFGDLGDFGGDNTVLATAAGAAGADPLRSAPAAGVLDAAYGIFCGTFGSEDAVLEAVAALAGADPLRSAPAAAAVALAAAGGCFFGDFGSFGGADAVLIAAAALAGVESLRSAPAAAAVALAIDDGFAFAHIGGDGIVLIAAAALTGADSLRSAPAAAAVALAMNDGFVFGNLGGVWGGDDAVPAATAAAATGGADLVRFAMTSSRQRMHTKRRLSTNGCCITSCGAATGPSMKAPSESH